MADLTLWLILIPLAGALIVGALPRQAARATALVFTALSASVATLMWRAFDSSSAALQLATRREWIPSLGAEFVIGIDGVSMMLVLLVALLVPFALAAQKMDRPFHALMLFMQAALFGTFTAQNFILWFLFYEASLIPAFLLIKIYGGENRDRAATKFFLFTFLGSAAMLLGMLAVYLHGGTFDFEKFAQLGKAGSVAGPLTWLAFAGVFIGLAVKVPVFPFHTWLPDAYTSAPTGVAMVLTGALSKMGVYGFIRLLLPLFPNEIHALQPTLLALAVASIVFASLAAWAQRDLKRMVAYLSINHLGYCTLGLLAVSGAKAGIDSQAALTGVLAQIFSHGITAATLFWFVGLLEARRGTREFAGFGGLMQKTPSLCGWMSVAMFSSLGLPGLNGFIGEFLIFKGAFALVPIASSVAALGLLFCAVTFLRVMQSLFGGPLAESCAALPDLSRGEKTIAVAVSALMLAIGVAPQWLLGIFNSTVAQLTRALGS
jgi:NADH-quinone oxidoreductase subunit M